MMTPCLCLLFGTCRTFLSGSSRAKCLLAHSDKIHGPMGRMLAKTQQTKKKCCSQVAFIFFLSGERDRARSSHTTPSSPLNQQKKTLHGRKRYPCVHRHVKARGVQDMGDCNAQRYRSIHPGNQPLHIYIHTLGAHTQHHMDYINIQTRFTPTFVKSTFLLVFKVPRHRKKIKTNKYTTHIELHIVVYALVSEGC